MLAADRATIQVSGQIYDVIHPKTIDAAAAEPQLPTGHRRTFRRFGIDNFMKAEPAPTSNPVVIFGAARW